MNILMLAKKLLRLKTQRADRLFTYPRAEQEKYLDKLYCDKVEEVLDEDSFESYEVRSYCQYLAQRELDGKFISFLTECASLFLYPFLLFKYRRNYSKVNRSTYNFENIDELTDKSRGDSNKRAVYLVYDADRSNFPHLLSEKYQTLIYENYNNSSLSKSDWEYLKKINKLRRFSFAYKLKNMIKLAIYRDLLEYYGSDNIQAVVVCAEYSYTSSILTHYLKQKNIDHIDVMHGEKLYYMRDSFCKFTELYVWDEHYKDLFKSLYVPEETIIVHNMTEGKWDTINNSTSNSDTINKEFKYCYYLANENEDELRQVKKNLDFLTAKYSGRYKVRLHPRYSDFSLVSNIFDKENIEKKGLDIAASLESTEYAISLYSTVLYQAYDQGVPIIIDDLKNPNYYNILKKLSYIILSKKHSLLSDLINA